MDLHYWNRIIYENEDGDWATARDGISAGEFWDKWGIQSWPKFTAAMFHIPTKWANDVRLMLDQVKSELGDRISFRQIKEKYCELTVYYRSSDNEASERMRELIKECVERLQLKKVYPITKEDYVRLINKSGEKNGQSQ